MSDFDCDPLFSRIYLEMLEQMTAYSARRLGDIGLAEDVAQDTFAECWKNWEQGQRVKYHPNPRGWLWEALKIKLKKMREDMEKGPHGAAGRAGPPACGTCGAEAVSE